MNAGDVPAPAAPSPAAPGKNLAVVPKRAPTAAPVQAAKSAKPAPADDGWETF